MDSYFLLILPAIAVVAFFLKGLTGFGPALIFIPIGALIFDPQSIIVASSFLDLTAGLIMWRRVRSVQSIPFLLGIVVAMSIGTVFGVYLLSAFPTETFRILLGIAVLILGLWFAVFRSRTSFGQLKERLPEKCNRKDIGYSAFAGISGGLFGISGPPIIWHLGKQYRMSTFRDLLIVFFVFAAIARIISFSVAGMVNYETMMYTVAGIPGLFIGLYFGTKVFLKIDEAMFSKAVGIALIAFAILLVV